MLRFAGFELDQQRAEIRGPDSGTIKLRPKAFDLLVLFATNPGRILSKQELMDAVWPNVHVGEDSLFQCIRELRTALGDNQRQILKLISGRGYMLDTEVLDETTPGYIKKQPAPAASESTATPEAGAGIVSPPRPGMRFGGAVAAAVGLFAIVGFAIATPNFWLATPSKRPPIIAMMPVVELNQDAQTTDMAASVTERLTDGLAKIDNAYVITPNARHKGASQQPASAPPAEPDYVVNSELVRGQSSWTLRARMIKTATGKVEAIPAVTIDDKDLDLDTQKTRLAAGVGHLLATRINALLNADAGPAATAGGKPNSGAKVAIEQATASIIQTSRERFTQAQAMLEKALADDPHNTSLQVALAGLQLRGVQMVWYSPADSEAAENNAKSLLERAVRTKPNSIPVLEAYCRFLNATNEFVESLVVCARTLSFDPWNGIALYHMGVAHIQLGRFEDALATFKQANRFDTPPVSRWTWLLGAGWSYVMMGRDEEALPWLERSIAITPASGRPLMLLAAAYQRVGRTDDAKAALAWALKIRPGSTASNIALPPKNASAAFLAASETIRDVLIEIGLPNR
ncbi:MAG: winged helix-turn-helix domain-containing protein [Pseudolabrys sp.]|nr:winged helix-turn-helix domain-containing protein [Pseudolabrys sp.]MDP2297105.1 winged helix-turn-helix domain-containing protein [Pseudolabrys sp.]